MSTATVLTPALVWTRLVGTAVPARSPLGAPARADPRSQPSSHAHASTAWAEAPLANALAASELPAGHHVQRQRAEDRAARAKTWSEVQADHLWSAWGKPHVGRASLAAILAAMVLDHVELDWRAHVNLVHRRAWAEARRKVEEDVCESHDAGRRQRGERHWGESRWVLPDARQSARREGA